MNRFRKILFGLALLVTVTLVTGADCAFIEDDDCEFFCDEN